MSEDLLVYMDLLVVSVRALGLKSCLKRPSCKTSLMALWRGNLVRHTGLKFISSGNGS